MGPGPMRLPSIRTEIGGAWFPFVCICVHPCASVAKLPSSCNLSLHMRIAAIVTDKRTLGADGRDGRRALAPVLRLAIFPPIGARATVWEASEEKSRFADCAEEIDCIDFC